MSKLQPVRFLEIPVRLMVSTSVCSLPAVVAGLIPAHLGRVYPGMMVSSEVLSEGTRGRRGADATLTENIVCGHLVHVRNPRKLEVLPGDLFGIDGMRRAGPLAYCSAKQTNRPENRYEVDLT